MAHGRVLCYVHILHCHWSIGNSYWMERALSKLSKWRDNIEVSKTTRSNATTIVEQYLCCCRCCCCCCCCVFLLLLCHGRRCLPDVASYSMGPSREGGERARPWSIGNSHLCVLTTTDSERTKSSSGQWCWRQITHEPNECACPFRRAPPCWVDTMYSGQTIARLRRVSFSLDCRIDLHQLAHYIGHWLVNERARQSIAYNASQ